MSSITTPTKPSNPVLDIAGKALNDVDERYHPAAGMRRQLNKVFPSHWSFLLGEIALYSFIVLLLSGVYLALWFDPSMTDVQYNGPFSDLRGIYMSKAYASGLDISFVVRGGLFVRQLHHWAALLFVASMAAHMIRVFFTGAFRKPRETNWVLGVLLLVLGSAEGFTGYGLPDDLLSGTGVRAALSGGVLSTPIIGTWLHWLLFGSEFPGTTFVPRMYAIHIVVLPAAILALTAVHVGLVWYQKHTQFPAVRRTENNVVGVRIMPVFALKGGGFFAVVVGVLALLSGLFQINPVWNFGPYSTAQIGAGSQPDWYLAWTDGLLRLWPDWEIYLGHSYMIPAVFFPLMVFGLTIAVMLLYPYIERRMIRDHVHHNLLQRPRDAPVRTGLGAMGLTFMLVLTIACGNDIIAEKLHLSINAITWAGRIGLLILPPIIYYVTYRICVGLQRADREVLEHGIETGIIKRLPTGGFIEIHQPLGGVDDHDHAKPLEYQGAPVPKKMNKLGSSGHPIPGSLLRADPVEETIALERARAEQHAIEHADEVESERSSHRDLPID